MRWSPHDGLSVLTGRQDVTRAPSVSLASLFFFSLLCEDTVRRAITSQEERPHQEPSLSDLDLGLSAPRTVENKRLLVKSVVFLYSSLN